MSLRTMSWAEALTDSSTRNPTRHSSSLNSYVPPHLRHNSSSSSSLSSEGYTPFVPRHLRHNSGGAGDVYTPYGRGGGSSFAQPRDYNRGGGGRGGGGRVGARSRGGFQSPNPRLPPTRDLSGRGDVAAEFEKLKVSEGGKVEDDDNVGGINFEAYEDIPVEASGDDVPAPASTFEEIDLGDCLNNNIKRCRYTKPTPVQRHAIPIALAGRDLMACAQTGSGKTAAFCFPIISGVLTKCLTKSNENDYTAFPAALILSPTRELASQIYEEARKFAANSGAKLAVVYGGAAIGQQLRCLERGVDILVATPGRLVDMIERERVLLTRIKYLALDEADRMLDMGFEQQIRRIVQQMGMPPPGARQTLLFSATFPQEIQRLAADFLKNYIFLTVGRVGSSTDLIAQKVEFVRDMDKLNHLSGILKNQRSNGTNGKMALTLVFVETKKGADQLENWLCRNGFRATAIHGDKVQFERERALSLFKCGTTPILVATDVASRGLDIPHVAHVINFDFPKTIDDYVHRIGRTGRAGKSGLATAFFTEKNQSLAQGLAEVMKESKQEVPKWLHEFAEQSLCYGGDQGQRNGSRNFGGYDFRRSENHYGSVGAPAVSFNSGSYAAGSYGYGGDCGAYSADAPAATFSDPSYTVPSGGENNVAGSADATGFGNYDNIVAGGWD